jgi:methyl coenzyme M reductase subunit C
VKFWLGWAVMVSMSKPRLHIECIDCKIEYDQEFREGTLWPPTICGACGSDRIVVGDENDRWQNNEVQFARLLSELVAAGIPQETIDGAAESMDLEPSEVQELFARAERVWESAVAEVIG